MENIKGYELIKEYNLGDVKSKGYLFKHKKTGARVAVVSNDDNNKVFSIGFRTPPKDSTGVAHILEHTVLCGSRKFKAKDPFVELCKGSLNTFLNAMTYPDKTVYPLASCNDKDFKNLMDVYLDSVFYPNIYNEEKIFMQEGWHYEMKDAQSDITYNGVVYNEMKGAFSSPEQVLYRTISSALFPDTTYATESGGDPEFIPQLSYEQFLDFHRKYYHPSNSYIYLYGNLDFKERMEWMDEEYLSAFDDDCVDSQIELQKAFDEMHYFEKSYPVANDENEDGQDEDEDKTYLAYATSFGLSTDSELSIAFEVLSYCLVDAPGAPLKQALLDAGFGRDIMGDFEAEIRQPIFSIIAKDSNPELKDEFVNKIKEVLGKIVKEGLDENAIRAALSRLEFKYREADFENFPKGLIYGLEMFAGWLYDDNLPFETLQLNKVYESLRQKIGTGYYEELIKKYVIDNTHSALIVVTPDKNLGKQREDELKQKLARYKESLSEEEINNIVNKTKELKEYQAKPSTKEQLMTLPRLTREDIGREPVVIKNEKISINNTDVIWHDIFTNGIIYCDMYFDLASLPCEYIPYLGLYTTALGYFNTKKHSYLELANLMNMYTGGTIFTTLSLDKSDEVDNCDYKLKVDTRCFYDYADKAFDIIREILCETDFSDEKHLLEVIRECRSRVQMRLNSASHMAAVKRCDSYYSKAGMFNELTSGISYYDFLVNAENNFDTEKEKIKDVFEALTAMIFSKSNVITSLTCDCKGKDIADNCYAGLMDNLSVEVVSKEEYKELTQSLDSSFIKDGHIFPVQKNEGYKFGGQVQYVARTGNFKCGGHKYSGALNVLKTILSYGYLWDNIRVLGGAYGCMVNFSRTGASYVVSYRDPELKKTNEVYEAIPEFLEQFNESEDEMTKYVVGTIGRLDTPMNPAAKGTRDFVLYYSGITFDDLVKSRGEVIDVTIEQIRQLAPVVQEILAQGNICTIGNETMIEQNREMFKQIKTLA